MELLHKLGALHDTIFSFSYLLVPIVLILFLIDTIMVLKIRRTGLRVKNNYIELHLKNNFIGINVIKIIVICYFIWELIKPAAYRPLYNLLFIFLYFNLIIKTCLDIRKAMKQEHSGDAP